MLNFAKHNRLGRRLLVYIVAISSLVTLLLTSMQLYREYRADATSVEQRLEQIRVSYVEVLGRSLWEVNDAAMQTQLDGITKLPDIVFAAVVDNTQTAHVRSGTPQTGPGFLERRYNLVFDLGNGAEQLGYLQVQASMAGVYQRLRERALVILATQGIKTFLVSLSILFIVHWLITQRVTRLAHAFTEVNVEKPPSAAVWQARRGDDADEIDDMVDALRAMHGRLYEAFAAVDRTRERFQRIFDSSSDAIVVIDPTTDSVVQSNTAASRLFGHSKTLLDKMPIRRLHGASTGEMQLFVAQVMESGDARVGVVGCVGADGDDRSVEVSASVIEYEGRSVVLAILRDRTEQQRVRQRIEQLAYFDPLTGLPNRSLCYDRVGVELARSRRHDTRGAVLFLDVDNFKTVNDSLGHSVGDQLLQMVAERIQKVLREEDTLARLGGDEFVILPHIVSTDIDAVRAAAERVAEKVGEAVRDTVRLAGHVVHVTTSIGIAVFPDDGGSVDELLRHADAAMYQAKANGRDGHHLYSAELDRNASVRLEMASALRQALQREEFVLDYQPQVAFPRGDIVGAEALVRWNRPGVGRVTPGDFLPLLHEFGLMRALGDWVLRRVCMDWRQAAEASRLPARFYIAVNVDAQQFAAGDFVEFVAALLHEYDMPGQCLELEITEQTVVQDVDDAEEKITALHALGVTVAIDDFGTGYSSLSHLHRLPVDTVKIDRSFVQMIGRDMRQVSLIDIIVAMGRTLGMRVVAEGVEHPRQAEHLAGQQCGFGQGFLYSRPISWDRMVSLLPAPTGPGTQQTQVNV